MRRWVLKEMPSEHPSASILAAYREHSLTPEEVAAVERHLVECRLCRETLKEVVTHEESTDKDEG